MSANKKIITATSRVDQLGREKSQVSPLIGDRIASMTKAVGIQPCGGCKKRQKWLNDKHQKLRELMKPKTEEV